MYREEIKVPMERVAVLVGKKGQIKRQIEKSTNSRIKIDSRNGSVEIISKDSLDLFDASQMIKAIARGFNPDIAMELGQEDYQLEIIDMQDFSGKGKAKFERLRGRCIGTNGKCRKLIEQYTGTDVSIYGKTIAIIGMAENVSLARKAFESLLNGAEHSNIYKWLEKKRSDLKLRL